MRKLIGVGVVLGGLALAAVAGPASAGIIAIEPDNFAAGTVLNNIVPGVTLRSIQGSPTSSGNITSTTASWGAASTGTRVFGGAFAATGDQFGNGTWDYMLIDVSGLGKFKGLSLDFIGTDSLDANPVLAAYDAAGNLVDSDTAAGNFSTGQFVNLSVSGSGITRVAALGDPGSLNIATFAGINNQASGGRDSWGLDNLEIRIPEPASLALFGIGLAGLGFAARRRRKAA